MEKVNRFTKVLMLLILGLLMAGCDDSGPRSWTLTDGRPAGSPIILYSGRDIYDQSFNESVFRAVEQFEYESGLKIRHIAGRPGDIDDDLHNMLKRNPAVVVGVGFGMAELVKSIAADYPDSRFVLVDNNSDIPNILSINFREEEGAFLAGVLSATKSTSNKIGFLGGMAVPVIQKMACAYIAGARYVSDDYTLIYGLVGDTAQAWENPETAVAMSRVMFNRGAKIIVTAAGSGNNTIHQIYRGRRDVYTIAVDMNKNHTAPGSILTSIVKDTGTSVVRTLEAVRRRDFKAGSVSYGLLEDGISLAIDQHNDTQIDAELRSVLTRVQSDIINGNLTKADLVPSECRSWMESLVHTDPDVKGYLEF